MSDRIHEIQTDKSEFNVKAQEQSSVISQMGKELLQNSANNLLGQENLGLSEKYFVAKGEVIRVQNMKDYRYQFRKEIQIKQARDTKFNRLKVNEDFDKESEEENEDQEGEDTKELQLKDKKMSAGSEQPVPMVKAGELSDKDEALASVQYVMSRKQIIVPTMGSLSEIFNNHLKIVRDLKVSIDSLKEAKYQHSDLFKSWGLVEQIIQVLNASAEYLDFPDDPFYQEKEGQRKAKALKELSDKVALRKKKQQEQQAIDEESNEEDSDFASYHKESTIAGVPVSKITTALGEGVSDREKLERQERVRIKEEQKAAAEAAAEVVRQQEEEKERVEQAAKAEIAR